MIPMLCRSRIPTDVSGTSPPTSCLMCQDSDASHLRPLANLEVSRKIGWIHIICYFTKNTYGIYSSFIYIHPKQIHIRNQLDAAYLALFIGLLISWIFFLDECLISYFVKKINNPKYKLGDDSDNMEDMIILFENKDKYKQFENTMTIFYFVSLYIVAYRSSDYIIPYLFGMFPKSYYFLVEIRRDAGGQSTDADASEVGGRSPTTSACLIASQSSNLRSPDALGIMSEGQIPGDIKTIWSIFFLLLYFSYIFSYKLLRYK